MRSHLAYKVRHFYENSPINLKELLIISNDIAMAELMYLFYLVLKLMEKYFKIIAKILILTFLILFFVYTYSEHWKMNQRNELLSYIEAFIK